MLFCKQIACTVAKVASNASVAGTISKEKGEKGLKKTPFDAFDDDGDDGASTVAPSGKSLKTISGASSIASTAHGVSGVSGKIKSVWGLIAEEDESASEEGGDWGGDEEQDLEDFKITAINPAVLAQDVSKFHDLVTNKQLWDHKDWSHLFTEDPEDPTKMICLPTQKRIYKDEIVGQGHTGTCNYVKQMKKCMLATEIFGKFEMRKLPTDPTKLPSFDEMRTAYGQLLPCYDVVSTYLPLKVNVLSGKKHTHKKIWTANSVLGMGVCYWNAVGGPLYFRGTALQGLTD